MREWDYTLRQRFARETAEDWDGYISFSGFQHIAELVTLDRRLCPELVTDLVTEDWDYNVHENYRTTLFRDADYLKTRQPFDPSLQEILAILERPQGDEMPPGGFRHCGFDIMDSQFHYSTITNCGQMPDIFDPSIVNEFGLIPTIELANKIRDQMRRAKLDDHHLGKCEVWSICRAEANQ